MSKIRMNTEFRNKILNRYVESAENMESANKLLDAHKLINTRESTNFTIVKFETPLKLTKEMEC